MRRDIVNSESGQFRDSESSTDRKVQHSPIAYSIPRSRIGCIQQSLHFFLVQIWNQTAVYFLEGNRQNTTDLGECAWFPMLKKAEERSDGRQADVPCVARVATCGLQVFQKRSDRSGIQLFQSHRRGRHPESLRGKFKQRLEAVCVRLAGMSAVAAMPDKILAEKCLDVRCDGGHDRPPCRKLSPATAISCIGSGVALRYQNVESMLTCPMYVAKASMC